MAVFSAFFVGMLSLRPAMNYEVNGGKLGSLCNLCICIVVVPMDGQYGPLATLVEGF